MTREKPTAIDLIFAETEADRIRLENMLGVSQEQMTDFFYAHFSADGLISRDAPQTHRQRLDAVRDAMLSQKNKSRPRI